MPKKNYKWEVGKAVPEIGPHSLAKHRILERYIKRYIEIVTANSSQEQLRITFVDGYAGGGRYRLGRQHVPGSPLILLNAVAAAEAELNVARPKGFRINADFIFIDEKKSNADFLRSEVEASLYKDRLDKTIHIINADFNERVDGVVRGIQARSPRAGRSIFLLDQYGWSQVAFRSIRAILNNLEKAEVFLTFSVDALIDYLSSAKFDLRAFGEIDADPGFVRELARIKESEQAGYRAVIQNGLYDHVQQMTGAQFYSPFFIKSPDAHRSYWFIHLSKHREARNEIGMIHWSENNTSIHHGGAGFNALGFSTGRDPEQMTMGYLFDEHASSLSRAALREQVPRIIFEGASAGRPPTLEEVFETRCNDTPVVRDILVQEVLALRAEGEVSVIDEFGKMKPRSKSIGWGDKIILSKQQSLFGPISGLRKKL